MAGNIKLNNPLGTLPQQKKGTGFLNIGKVIDANAGNHLGSTVAQGVAGSANQVQQGIGDLKNQFIQQSDQNNLASDANKSAVSQALLNIAGGQSQVSEDQAKQFGTFLGGNYAGPKQLDDSKTIQLGAKAQEAQGFGQALGSQGDKTRLLQAFAGQGPYSTGQVKLDSLLLGKGPNAQQDLAAARQQTKGLTQQLSKEQLAAQQIGQLRTNQAQQFAQQTGQQIAGQEQAINTNLTNSLQTAKTDAEAKYNKYLQGLASRRLGATPELQQQLSGTQLYRTNANEALDLSGLVEKGADPTLKNIASLSQRGQLEALARLGQKDPSQLGFAQDVYDPSKAVGFNKTKLDQMTNAGKQAYEQRLNQVTYSPETAPTTQSTNPEMQKLIDKWQQVGLTVPERLRYAQFQGSTIGAPGSKQYEQEVSPYKNLLEMIKQQQGYYDVIS